MLLSVESYRVRWLVLVAVWTLSSAYLLLETSMVGDYLKLTGRMGLRGTSEISTPLKETYPVFAADAQVWVRHALALLEGHDVRLRHTTIDNAPKGREVHWNSAWAWCIAGAGWVYHLGTGLPIELSVERATLWLSPIVHIILMALLSGWATKRGGLIAGVVVAVAIVTNDRMCEGFFPTYVDHHGLLTMSVLATFLGALFAGGGWWQASSGNTARVLPASKEDARSAAVFSAIAGACGLWVSAASVIPAIALVGIMGLVATVVYGRIAKANGATFDAQVWRLWGRTGAVASLLFYLVEYFPNHLGLRLEANHPLHAIAWLAGGELIAQISERALGERHRRWANLKPLIWPLAAVGIVPVVVIIGGARVFSILDPFMARLHNDYIQEFLPIWVTMRSFGKISILQNIAMGLFPILGAVATLTYRRKETPIVLVYGTLVAGTLLLMALAQSRWLLNGTAGQIALLVVLLCTWMVNLRPVYRWTLAAVAMGVLLIPNAVLRHYGMSEQTRTRQVSPSDALAPFNRDIAAVIRASQPTGEIVLLSSPNSSTGVGYYGRFKTLGTLYWENTEGLKAAASILGANSDEEAAALIRAHGVTHIALIQQENFIEQYYRLLHPKATIEEIRRCFGLRILADKVVPQWLQMIPYKLPDDLSALKHYVMLFKVNFSQTMPEALYNMALAQIAAGNIEDGERILDQLTSKTAPKVPEPWLRKGELLLTRHAWLDAAEHIVKGISLAPAESRPGLYSSTASTFYNQGQHGIAAQVYRLGLKDRPQPEIAGYLAWILATSPENGLRNGKESLELAQVAVKADPKSPSQLSVLSAALAELGRFPEAIEVADRALASSIVRKDDANLQKEFSARLEILKSGKPLRYPITAATAAPAK
jgi:tetratricopeptide (TPR) repeat protein